MLKNLKLISILFFLLLIHPVAAAGLELPRPQGYVNDFAQVLTEQTREELNNRLSSLERETGIEAVVVTVESLQETTIEDYAVRLFEDWKIGKKGKDNGVLLLVAANDRRVRIEVGYGLEPVLTDSRAGRIIRDEITPAFKEGNYDQGVRDGAAAIEQVVRSRGETVTGGGGEDHQGKPWSLVNTLLIAGSLILFEYLVAFLGRSRAIWPGAVLGGVGGAILGIFFGSMILLAVAVTGLSLVGLFLDYVLSTNYRERQRSGLPTSWRHSGGGFARGSSGFGGFGGGGSGGGGASGSW